MIGIVGNGSRGCGLLATAGAGIRHCRSRLGFVWISGIWGWEERRYGRVGIGPASHTEVQCGCRTDICFATASMYSFAAVGNNNFNNYV